jgi:hypothetical protein
MCLSPEICFLFGGNIQNISFQMPVARFIQPDAPIEHHTLRPDKTTPISVYEPDGHVVRRADPSDRRAKVLSLTSAHFIILLLCARFPP